MNQPKTRARMTLAALGAAAVLGAAWPADAVTRTVTLNTDTVPGTPAGTGAGTAGDLRHAMSNATAGDVIEFDCGAPCTITLAGPLPVIGLPYTVDGGNNLIIDGAGTWRAFFVNTTTGTVTISNLTIRNVKATGGNGGAGRYGGGGGAGLGAGVFINNAAADVTLSKVRFIDARAAGGNGGTSDATNDWLAPGGGGGLGGNGGNGGDSLGVPGGGGGGGGALFGSNGFGGNSFSGGNGATYGGGGGADYNNNTNGTGGASAYPTGETAGANGSAGFGGAGGFGGGGGGSSWPNQTGGERGGAGGYGAGSGGSHGTAAPTATGGGGAGGLNGSKTPTALIPGGIRGGVGRNGGGGGAAVGPAVFVRAGILTTIASTTTGQEVTAGTGGASTGGIAGDDGQTDATAVYNVAGTINGSATTGPLASPLPAPSYGLTVGATGTGRITSSIGSLDCPGACSATIDTFTDTSFTAVTLTAIPGTGKVVGSWSGDCSGSSTTQVVTMSAAHACAVTFQDAPAPPPTPPAPTPSAPIIPSFVVAPPAPVIPVAGSASGSGQISLASSFSGASGLTFTAQQPGGAPLPGWLSFDPASVTFRYAVPVPAAGTLPVQGADVRARATRVAPANLVYAPAILLARVPVTLTASGGGQTYVTTLELDFYAPRGSVALAVLSMGATGTLGNGPAGRSVLSWDGGQAVFETAATNLFPYSINNFADVLRYDGVAGMRDRLSQTAIPGGGVANTAAGATVSPAVSADGAYAAFASDAPGISMTPAQNRRQVYRASLVYPRVPLNEAATPAPLMVSVTAAGIVGNAASDNPAMSQDGRYIVFDSAASNFAPLLDGTRQIWRKDVVTGDLMLVSSAAGPGNGTSMNPSISWDGRFVAFESTATNLLFGTSGSQIYLKDVTTGALRLVSAANGRPGTGASTAARLSARADRVVFVTTAGDLGFANPAGRAQVAVADVGTGTIRLASTGTGAADTDADQPAMSADGRFVAFRAGQAGTATQVWIRDVERGVTALVSQSASGSPGNGASGQPAVSGDGATVTFTSAATDLVGGNPTGTQAYVAGNPLPLPDRTGYWYQPAASGQGWVMERWGNRSYVGGLVYDADGRATWMVGTCTSSDLTCAGGLTGLSGGAPFGSASGPVPAATAAMPFSLVTAADGRSITLQRAGFPAATLQPFPIGGPATTGYAGLPQAGWWSEAGATGGNGYFLAIDTQTAADGTIAQVAYVSVLTFDTTGRAVWYASQATLAADLSFSGTLNLYTGGAAGNVSAVGPLRLTFQGTERATMTLPNGRVASLQRFRF